MELEWVVNCGCNCSGLDCFRNIHAYKNAKQEDRTEETYSKYYFLETIRGLFSRAYRAIIDIRK